MAKMAERTAVLLGREVIIIMVLEMFRYCMCCSLLSDEFGLFEICEKKKRAQRFQQGPSTQLGMILSTATVRSSG